MQPTGLTTQEAQAQFRKFGPNEIVKAKKLSVFLDFLQRFRNPLLLILIFGAIASGVLGDPITAAIIIVIVIASVLVDFINTYRSQKAADDLKKRVMLTTTVLRDGKECELPFAQLVPNDVVVLHPGDIIPADGVVSDLRDLYVNESQLTGESFPVEKQEGTQVFMGSNVTTGKAFLTVQQTGRDTKFSHIAESLIKRDVLTEFDRGLLEFSVLIMKLTLILVAAIFLVDTILKQNLLESLLFSIALAIGLTPELLPMIIAVNLSKGSLAMAKQGVIVKKLSAIQNFGNMDILCTDKTGTLTQDTIQVVRYVDENGGNSDSVLLAAYVNSEFSTGFRSPLDAAIKAFKNLDISAYTRIDEIPFDFDRRRDSVIVELNNEHVLIAKGAPEQVIQACITYGGSAELTADAHAKIIAEYESLSKDGFRVLGVAKKHMPNSKQAYVTSDEQDMTFLGFIAFFDPPKESVSKTLQMLEKYGVEIKVLTGDNDLVTKKVCDEIALPIKGILLGSEIEHLTDDQLKTQAEQTTIFARVSPDQKERIIRILRENGHVVGYLGDGINDAPPLKAADVGISVNNAVDVAKDTADLILLEKSLENLIAGVIEGRRIFANTMKYLMMGLSSNFGNMFSMAGASVLLPFLPMTAPQIL